ncbi:MAG: chemotaxis protein methyltransferase [Candidatus Tectimicrobiota bacterium]|nr:MAG: chemotaxis protein methyltransferase [Candidatus Tectomicrobia bacterium]
MRTRLGKRLRALGLPSFAHYLRYLAADASGQERQQLIEALTTNKTGFFREPQHFAFLQRELPALCRRSARLRFWSAGCASGEEPYSLAMVLWEHVPDLAQRDVRILATDIATAVLQRARQGRYDAQALQAVPAPLRHKYFTAVAPGVYRVQARLRALVRFARLNLLDPWPMRGPFDVILCRNVMIYFDRETRANLVQRFVRLLSPGGYLFTGHAESLVNLAPGLRYVQPAVYQKR